MDRQNLPGEDENKEAQAAALGRLIFEKYYGGGDVDSPRTSAAGMNFIYPQGISQGEKANLDAYIKRLRQEQE